MKSLNLKKRYLTPVVVCLIQITLIHSQTINCGDWLPTGCKDEFLAFVEYTLENGECKQWKDDCDLDRPIYRIGKVSIGTSKSGEYSLTVTDGVVSPNVKICDGAGSWCDYVFEDDYNLLSLAQVKQYIQENGHLHNTASAAEIEKEGSIDLGDVALDHQEKIEEIFLHLIAMKKKANALQERLNILVEENKELKQGLKSKF